jgi:hypothetical protein
LRHIHYTVKIERGHKGEPLLCCVSLRLRQSDATSHSEQKHGAVRIAPSRLNKSQSRSGASNGSRVLGSPKGHFLLALRMTGPPMDQTDALLGYDHLQAVQVHGPDWPAWRLKP